MNILVRKLSGYDALSAEDGEAVEQACRATVRLGADRKIIEEGDKPSDVLVVLEGWAIRYKILEDGSRQILAFLLPGDLCDICASVLQEMDHGVATLTPVTLARIPRAKMEALLADRPILTRAMLWAQLVNDAVSRAWIVSLGRRDAFARVAHLFCELWARATNVGLALDHSIELPLTQTELSDALGLTAVHVNRVLQRLRSEGLIDLGGGILSIPDIGKLGKAAGFDANYLHRRISGRRVDSAAG